MENKKVFHELSRREQNKIRRMYKEYRKKDYDYSIKLYILYVVLGILGLIGLLFVIFKLYRIGFILFSLSFILMIFDIYLLYKSNNNFKKFLEENGYIYDAKN